MTFESEKEYIHAISENFIETNGVLSLERNALYYKLNNIFNTFYKNSIEATIGSAIKFFGSNISFFTVDKEFYFEYALIRKGILSGRTEKSLIKKLKSLACTIKVLEYDDVAVYKICGKLTDIESDIGKPHILALGTYLLASEDEIDFDYLAKSNIHFSAYQSEIIHNINEIFDKEHINARIDFGEYYNNIFFFEGKLFFTDRFSLGPSLTPHVKNFVADWRETEELAVALKKYGYSIEVYGEYYCLCGEIPTTNYYSIE